MYASFPLAFAGPDCVRVVKLWEELRLMPSWLVGLFSSWQHTVELWWDLGLQPRCAVMSESDQFLIFIQKKKQTKMGFLSWHSISLAYFCKENHLLVSSYFIAIRLVDFLMESSRKKTINTQHKVETTWTLTKYKLLLLFRIVFHLYVEAINYFIFYVCFVT